jgi:oligopeptide transport system ATP-binding protein
MNNQNNNAPLLIVDDLHKTYSMTVRKGLLRKHYDLKAVDGVSFEVNFGETVGVVGESGCGKSTLGRTLARLNEPTSGKVTFDGNDFLELSKEDLRRERKNIQFIFQDPYSSLDPRMSVEQIIGEIWRVFPEILPKDKWRRRAQELLELVGLNAQDLDRYPHQFSGGQRQRIGIARALACEPKLIICDEPVSALDVSIQAQVINLFQDIQERTGVALIFIAHDLSVVRHIADRTLVMYLGKVVEEGASYELFNSPSHPYTQALVSAVPMVDPEARVQRQQIDLLGEPPNPIDKPAGCVFRTRCWQTTDQCSITEPKLNACGFGRHVACHFPEPKNVLGIHKIE